MTRDYPIELPFGIRLAACHGLPMLVVGFMVVVFGLLTVAAASRAISPISLTGIWIDTPTQDSQQLPEINSSTVNQQEPVLMGKAGNWSRLCPSYAVETYFDDRGHELARGERHEIAVPNFTGPIQHAPRPITIPKTLANTPGIYKLRLDVYSGCWPWERIFPIYSTSAEAVFRIVADR